MKILFFSRVVALVLSATLAACGGGGSDEAPVTVQAVAKSVAKVTTQKTGCEYAGSNVLVGESGRSAICFVLTSKSRVGLNGMVVALAGASERQITNVSLSVLSGSVWQDLTEKTAFTNLKLKLKPKDGVTFDEGVAYVLRITFDAKWVREGVAPDTLVRLTASGFDFEYDKNVYSGAEVSTPVLTSEAILLRDAGQLSISSLYTASDFWEASEFTFAWVRVTNPERFDARIKQSVVDFSGNFAYSREWVERCVKQLTLTYYDQWYRVIGSTPSISASSYNTFQYVVGVDGLPVKVVAKANNSIHVRISAATGDAASECVSWYGSNLQTSLRTWSVYEDLDQSESFANQLLGTTALPVSPPDGKG